MEILNYVGEIWKPVLGYEGFYEVSNYGRVRSLTRYVKTAIDYHTKRLIKGKLLKSDIVSGYDRVDLCVEGSVAHYFIHRLVWGAFNGPIPEGMQINHLNEDKTDNRLENLSLVTPKENVNWGTGIERMMRNRKGKTTPKAICQYTTNNELVRRWGSFHEIERVCGYNNGYICACCRGKYKTAYGFIWRYAE